MLSFILSVCWELGSVLLVSVISRRSQQWLFAIATLHSAMPPILSCVLFLIGIVWSVVWLLFKGHLLLIDMLWLIWALYLLLWFQYILVQRLLVLYKIRPDVSWVLLFCVNHWCLLSLILFNKRGYLSFHLLLNNRISLFLFNWLALLPRRAGHQGRALVCWLSLLLLWDLIRSFRLYSELFLEPFFFVD